MMCNKIQDGNDRPYRRPPPLEDRIRRAARRVAREHERLESRYAALAAGLQNGSLGEVRAAMARFQAELEAHFVSEEGTLFPMLRAHEPSLRSTLAELEQEHQRFREQMLQMNRRLEAGEVDAAGGFLDRLIMELATHDGREELLLEPGRERTE